MFPLFCNCPASHIGTLRPRRGFLIAGDPVGEVVAASLRPEQVSNQTGHRDGGYLRCAPCRRFERRPARVKPGIAAALRPTHF